MWVVIKVNKINGIPSIREVNINLKLNHLETLYTPLLSTYRLVILGLKGHIITM